MSREFFGRRVEPSNRINQTITSVDPRIAGRKYESFQREAKNIASLLSAAKDQADDGIASSAYLDWSKESNNVFSESLKKFGHATKDLTKNSMSMLVKKRDDVLKNLSSSQRRKAQSRIDRDMVNMEGRFLNREATEQTKQQIMDADSQGKLDIQMGVRALGDDVFKQKAIESFSKLQELEGNAKFNEKSGTYEMSEEGVLRIINEMQPFYENSFYAILDSGDTNKAKEFLKNSSSGKYPITKETLRKLSPILKEESDVEEIQSFLDDLQNKGVDPATWVDLARKKFKGEKEELAARMTKTRKGEEKEKEKEAYDKIYMTSHASLMRASAQNKIKSLDDLRKFVGIKNWSKLKPSDKKSLVGVAQAPGLQDQDNFYKFLALSGQELRGLSEADFYRKYYNIQNDPTRVIMKAKYEDAKSNKGISSSESVKQQLLRSMIVRGMIKRKSKINDMNKEDYLRYSLALDQVEKDRFSRERTDPQLKDTQQIVDKTLDYMTVANREKPGFFSWGRKKNEIIADEAGVFMKRDFSEYFPGQEYTTSVRKNIRDSYDDILDDDRYFGFENLSPEDQATLAIARATLNPNRNYTGRQKILWDRAQRILNLLREQSR